MQSNPYLAQHFGGLEAHPHQVPLDDSDDDSIDASEGFAHFKNPAHMKFSVFKPSKPSTKLQVEPPSPDQRGFTPVHGGRTSPPGFQFVPGQRRGLCIDNFPSKPSTPRSTSANSSFLPPLMPTRVSPTPRTAHARRGEDAANDETQEENGAAASPQLVAESETDTESPPSPVSPASPYSPYTHKLPVPATQHIVGSPPAQHAAVFPASGGASPALELTTSIAPITETPSKTHSELVSDLVQRSKAALQCAQAAMMEGKSATTTTALHQVPAVDVSPATPSLSPPPPFVHSGTPDPAFYHRDLPRIRSGPLDDEDEADTFSSENIAFVSPVSELADDNRLFAHGHGDGASTRYQLSVEHVHATPTRASDDDMSLCLHAALVLNTDAIVRRRLSRRPVATHAADHTVVPMTVTCKDVASSSASAAKPPLVVRSAERDMHSVRSRPRATTAATTPVPVSQPLVSTPASATAAADNPSPTTMTLDSLNSMIENLGRFLHHGQPPPPFGPRDAQRAASEKPHTTSQHHHVDVAVSPGQRTFARIAPAPTVVAGRQYPQRARVATAAGTDMSRSTTHVDSFVDDAKGVPSYAQPTESWKSKRENALEGNTGYTL